MDTGFLLTSLPMMALATRWWFPMKVTLSMEFCTHCKIMN
ncbi:hypothetical protein NSPZN2_100426 [Nitrospira defluvii]|uniref:Uncharacterized protein n=1 Tax=Nitrospira defluvii TaxID=330214 RepID=A0ABM8R4J0_9BACT|nr:hypothetical protein NSPZN2_100426 [Nitrospira defluvii]